MRDGQSTDTPVIAGEACETVGPALADGTEFPHLAAGMGVAVELGNDHRLNRRVPLRFKGPGLVAGLDGQHRVDEFVAGRTALDIHLDRDDDPSGLLRQAGQSNGGLPRSAAVCCLLGQEPAGAAGGLGLVVEDEVVVGRDLPVRSGEQQGEVGWCAGGGEADEEVLDGVGGEGGVLSGDQVQRLGFGALGGGRSGCRGRGGHRGNGGGHRGGRGCDRGGGVVPLLEGDDGVRVGAVGGGAGRGGEVDVEPGQRGVGVVVDVGHQVAQGGDAADVEGLEGRGQVAGRCGGHGAGDFVGDAGEAEGVFGPGPGGGGDGLAGPSAVGGDAQAVGAGQAGEDGEVDGVDRRGDGEAFLEGGDDVRAEGSQPPQHAVALGQCLEGGAARGGECGCLVGQAVDVLLADHHGHHRAVDTDGTASGGVVGERVVDHVADRGGIVGDQGVPPRLRLVLQVLVHAVEALLFGGQVGGGLRVGVHAGLGAACVGQPRHITQVEGAGLGPCPLQGQLGRDGDRRRLERRKGLQMNAGGLQAQLVQEGDRGVTGSVLLGAFGLQLRLAQLRG